MPEERHTLRFYAFSRVILTLCIIVLANVLLLPVSLRWDLTEAKLYTLSESSKTILGNLKDPVTLKIFFSDPNELPKSLITVRQNVLSLIDEFKKAAGNNLIVEKINPKKDEKFHTEAKNFGIPEIQFSKYGDKEVEIKTGYAGMTVIYHEEGINIPVITGVENIEFEITSAINKLTREKDPVIGVLTDRGSHIAAELKNELLKQYIVWDISFGDGVIQKNGIDALIISGPAQEFTNGEKFELDQFVMRGGKLLALLDGVHINHEYLTASLNDVSLNSILGSYGVKVLQDVVLDPLSHQVLVFKTGHLNIPVSYPAYPKIIRKGLDRKHPITKTLPSLTFPFVSSLKIDESKFGKDTLLVKLAQTTEKSFAISGNGVFLEPKQLKNYDPLEEKPHLLAVLISGHMSSAFIGEDVPQRPTVEGKEEGTEDDAILTFIENGQIMVISSSRFLQPDILRDWPENKIFLENALDFLVQGKELIDIRSRNVAHRPLEPIEENRANAIRYGNIFASVVLSVITGVTAYAYRRYESNKAKARYKI